MCSSTEFVFRVSFARASRSFTTVTGVARIDWSLTLKCGVGQGVCVCVDGDGAVGVVVVVL